MKISVATLLVAQSTLFAILAVVAIPEVVAYDPWYWDNMVAIGKVLFWYCHTLDSSNAGNTCSFRWPRSRKSYTTNILGNACNCHSCCRLSLLWTWLETWANDPPSSSSWQKKLEKGFKISSNQCRTEAILRNILHLPSLATGHGKCYEKTELKKKYHRWGQVQCQSMTVVTWVL